MKNLLLLAILSLSAAQPISAATACRDYKAVGPDHAYNALPVRSAVIAVDSSISATLTWPEGHTSSFALKGTLCGPNLEPLAHQTIEIVRFESDDPDHPADAVVTTSALASMKTFERYRIETSDKGKFALAGLAPGSYAMEVDWTEIGTNPPLVFDIKILPGYRNFLPTPDEVVGEAQFQ